MSTCVHWMVSWDQSMWALAVFSAVLHYMDLTLPAPRSMVAVAAVASLRDARSKLQLLHVKKPGLCGWQTLMRMK